ncbi:ligase-associated DNA damage response endonuclease PdeM [Tianweitania sp.]|uniref:ligase-associated DNA damage response endonuclease PdeM n=1 Tax=Tianweitania sp. TaxID=2021634 RepID=UPI00289D531E|nr:ligase-associated DNA damage response endonuclease PdeM [Tianweitania sp.]
MMPLGINGRIRIEGQEALCDRSGALWFADHSLLVVSDLHLEKGSAFARRGSFLPPYDTATTLLRLAVAIEHYQPKVVVSLGDSFHDGWGSERMPDPFRAQLADLQKGRDWYWITGNHDPDAPKGVCGESVTEIALAGLIFRHEPTLVSIAGEIAGHLHPGARIVQRGRSVRRRCFAGDGRRLVMPAFGAFTGTLNVLDRAYRNLFDWSSFRAHMMGDARIYTIAPTNLHPG